jgi:adenylylsulfate kinase
MAQNQGFTVWLTGMLGAGKSSTAGYIAARLKQVGRNVEILDEDELGETLWGENEGATKEERLVISRRIAFVADLLTRNGTCVLVACTSPYKVQREEARRLIQKYVEVYVDCPTDELIKRDSTGKYKKALAGEIPNFVGITEPYEPPNTPEVTIHTNMEELEAGGLKIFQSLLDLALVTTEEVKVITGTRLKANPKPKKGGKAGKPEKAEKKDKADKKDKGEKKDKKDKKKKK